MKRVALITGAALAMLALASCGNGGEAKKEAPEAPAKEEKAAVAEKKTFTIDVANSAVVWKGSIVGMHFHEGTVALTAGSLNWEGENLVGGEFTIDMNSIVPTDENYSEEHTAEMLIGHLKTADFFDTENHPTATFEITGADLAAGTIDGNLTIRGKSNPETVQNVVFDNATAMATGTLTFDRQKYDVAYESTMKDMVLSNDIELKITLKPNM